MESVSQGRPLAAWQAKFKEDTEATKLAWSNHSWQGKQRKLVTQCTSTEGSNKPPKTNVSGPPYTSTGSRDVR